MGHVGGIWERCTISGGNLSSKLGGLGFKLAGLGVQVEPKLSLSWLKLEPKLASCWNSLGPKLNYAGG